MNDNELLREIARRLALELQVLLDIRALLTFQVMSSGVSATDPHGAPGIKIDTVEKVEKIVTAIREGRLTSEIAP